MPSSKLQKDFSLSSWGPCCYAFVCIIGFFFLMNHTPLRAQLVFICSLSLGKLSSPVRTTITGSEGLLCAHTAGVWPSPRKAAWALTTGKVPTLHTKECAFKIYFIGVWSNFCCTAKWFSEAFLFIFFSIMACHRILNMVPWALQWDLLFIHPVYNSSSANPRLSVLLFTTVLPLSNHTSGLYVCVSVSVS